ncbi:MAG: histidinol-phosphate aminotransferase [Actinomycetota bacterium]|jgi:histidinol-phosphate/aromatic aminotransferase/cobyric acid decarboxylase-like protein|nr:histidinol-phosphate aminotransferase [Actinomycetota bacterium]
MSRSWAVEVSPVRTSVAPLPGAHGGDGARLAAVLGVDPDHVLDLSASLNPCAPDVAVLAAHHLGRLRHYPDPTAATAALAHAIGVDADRLVLTGGGSEAIALVAHELVTGHVRAPEFSLYERHLPVLDAGAGRWRSNPNNPTGELAAPSDRAAVWDEAFWPLAAGTWTRGDTERGAVVVGSLTKVFACPGLRVGYVIAPTDDLADRLRRRQPMWSVSSLACALVPDLLEQADLPAWQTGISRLRADLTALLRAAGYQVGAAAAPWALVSPAGDLRDRLADHAVLVRDCASFGLTDTVRIAVPDAAGLDRLAAALPVAR